ncbi:hypothetical protein FSST1_009966 [Fusarium sambucinum]
MESETKRVHVGDVYASPGSRVYAGIFEGYEPTPTAEDCKNALFVFEPSTARAELLRYKGSLTPGTCEWIRSNDDYNSWLQSDDSQLLWISGGPGRGKTMLSIFLSQEMESLVQKPSPLVLYVFCGDNVHTSEIDIVRSLLYQILKHSLDLARHVIPRMGTKERMRHTLSSRGDLWEIFTHMISDPELGPIVCLIDGLDECAQDAISWLLQNLRQIFGDKTQSRIHPGSSVKLAIVSRPMAGLSGYRRVDLENISESTTQDIIQVIDARIKEQQLFSELDESFEEDIKNTLKEKAQGTFLWVGFAIRELLLARTKTEMQEVLRSLPKDLKSLYSRILLRIKDQWRGEVARLTSWVIQARHPLTALQLADALKMEVQTVHDLVTLSGSLLTWDDQTVCPPALPGPVRIRPPKIYWNPNEKVLKVVHASVSDFLKCKATSDALLPRQLRMSVEKTEFEMAQSCLAQINSGFSGSALPRPLFFLESRREVRYTFLTYATYHWVEHANSCGKRIDELFDPRNRFFQSEDDKFVRLKWWIEYYVHHWFKRKENTNVPLLQVCSSLGLLSWATRLLDETSKDVDYEGAFGFTALHYAFTNQHQLVARALVDHGADLTWTRKHVLEDEFTYKYVSPIGMALQIDPLMAQPYLQAALGKSGSSFLRWFTSSRNIVLERDLFENAVNREDDKALQILLDNGAVLDSRTAYPALSRAVSSHIGLPAIKWLLDHGADANASEKGLVLTAINNYPPDAYERVKALLEYGADPNRGDDKGSCPVQEAVKQVGSKTINLNMIDLLHQHGAEMARFDAALGTAITMKDRTDVLQLLLQLGGNTNMCDNSGQPALHRAILNRNGDAMRLLLQHGANVNAQDSGGMTALHQAIDKMNGDAMRLLLQHGADVNAQDSGGKTALHHAKTQEFAKILLDRGADVNARDTVLETPLLYALRTGHENLAELLLSRGAQFDVQDADHNAPLTHAAKGNNVALIHELLQRGANPNASNTHGMTPLRNHVAAYNRPYYYNIDAIQIAILLINWGANVNTKQGPEGDTPARTVLDELPCERLTYVQAEVARLLFQNGARSLLYNREPLLNGIIQGLRLRLKPRKSLAARIAFFLR